MRKVLTRHPDSPRAGAAGVEVEVARPSPGVLALRYVLTGVTDELVLPAVAAPVRTDGLWRHTCFEAFVAAPGTAGYREFNFSPSTEWAAYRFDGYRQGMRPDAGVEAPRVAAERAEGGFELQVRLGLEPAGGPWRLGLSAVIEAAGGLTSYWALAHPPGKPDFHHADCLALELPATGDA